MTDNKKETERIVIQHGLLIAKIFAKKYYVVNRYKKKEQDNKETISIIFRGSDYKNHLPKVETMDSSYCYEIQRVTCKENSHELNVDGLHYAPNSKYLTSQKLKSVNAAIRNRMPKE